MLPIIFINCRKRPFLDQILLGDKRYETRTRNMLGRFLGERVLLAETGNGRPVVRCSAVITEVHAVYTQECWEKFRSSARIPKGSEYDWKPETKVKWLYKLDGVVACYPFTPPESIRHGRVWMEYSI